MLGTDINDIDSDDDGLTDYQEVYITGTDPNKYDSVTEDISDADADSDGDGLSNAQETALGTDPQLSDTDDDNLSDYDELYVYGTDPLNPDMDGDGLDDGDEPHIGLDPTNPETFGIPDAEYKVEQTISADSDVLADINTTENAYELSIDIKTNGYAEKEVTVSTSSYSYAIENDAMIGLSADIFISDTCNPEEIVLKYNIKETYIGNTLNLYSSLEEFQGIKRLNIFKFYEDTNMLLPVETKFDVENGVLYTEVDELGTYCIMDMEIWLNNLGVKMPEEIQPEENAMYFNSPSILSASEDSGSVWTPTYVNAPIDLVFLLQTAGTSQANFNTEKNLIQNFSAYVFNKYENVNVTIITFDKSNANILRSPTNNMYLRSSIDVYSTLNRISYKYEPDYCDREQAFSQLLDNNIVREDADKFVYQLVNGKSSSYVYNNHFSVINGLVGNYSEIFPNGWHYEDSSYGASVKRAIEKNGNLYITLDDDTYSKLTEHLEGKLSPARPVYEILLPTKWKKISLDGELGPDNNIDTDGDTLTDWEEVDIDELIELGDGNYTLPETNLKSLLEALKRYNNDNYLFITGNTLPIYYLPILSDPTTKDTDNDGLLDTEDPKLLSTFNYGISLGDLPLGEDKELAQLQHWLVDLGYLDMKDNPYGKLYGPITETAVHLYRLNHGLSDTTLVDGKEVVLNNVDDITYATIANEYSIKFGNGKSDYINYVENISDKPYFDKIRIVEPKLTKHQIDSGIKIVKKDNSYIKSNSAEKFDMYYYDYTDPLNKKMAQNIYFCILKMPVFLMMIMDILLGFLLTMLRLAVTGIIN
ncbi:MAG: hypothetical protein NC093_09390 [Alistipes sp.]|nr:hypothetical protein [Alistipes sp.]